jgi:predicted permease
MLPSLVLSVAARVYRAVLRLAPRSFRERFSTEAESSFRELIEDELDRRGPGAAAATAAAAYGDAARIGVVERAARWRGGLVSGLSTDIRHALRVYSREPLLVAAIALTLSLVAGPALAIYGVMHHLLFMPLPYQDPDRLVVIVDRTPRGANRFLPAASVQDFRAASAFATVGGIRPLGVFPMTDGQPERMQSYQVTAGLLGGLGVPFAAGRDIARGAADELVVTRAFARSRFGSERAAIGQAVLFDRQRLSRLTIVGVLADLPVLPRNGPPLPAPLFTPHQVADAPERPDGGQAIVIARLADGVELAQAAAEVRTIAANVRAQFGEPEVTPELVPLRVAIGGTVRVPLLVLGSAVTMVFAVALWSLAGLVLARAVSRASEVAIRTSLGASRWRLVRGWLVGGTVLAVPGVILGVLVSHLLLGSARSALPPQLLPLPDRLDAQVTAIAGVGLCLMTSALFALAPVAAGLTRPALTAMREGARQITGLRRIRSQELLIVSQVAVSLVLVVAAVWLSMSLSRMFSRPLGFEPDGLTVIRIDSAQSRGVQTETMRALTERLRQIDSASPTAVALTSAMPGVNAALYGPLRLRPGQPAFKEDDRPRFSSFAVSRDYFRVIGIPFLAGRTFTADEEADAQGAIIVSRSFASQWFPEGALGQIVTLASEDRRLVVGVVEDVHASRLNLDAEPQFYVPFTDLFPGTPPNTVILRTGAPVPAVRDLVSGVLREHDPKATLIVASARDVMGMPLLLQRAANALTIALAAVALLLAVINVYALAAFVVVQRTREVGIRLALGARAADATRLVMRRGLIWMSVGIAIGAGVSVAVVGPLIERQLFRTRPGEPALLGLAVVLVLGASTLASWLPARRAARIDPAITLRAE